MEKISLTTLITEVILLVAGLLEEIELVKEIKPRPPRDVGNVTQRAKPISQREMVEAFAAAKEEGLSQSINSMATLLVKGITHPIGYQQASISVTLQILSILESLLKVVQVMCNQLM
eukprot:Blabericola_migrator_1__2233@NODE_1616_length_4161_cov_8_859551_g1053_i0_p6_GENE_NODE_1616_length_4161_cov_8_859551_g1053_i0NODE_1616_length_4161_cov_8_859551_g1053_i0_p6_ORF_typecomplete_len117_score19_46_NODE_1616_length_4161_cov_8_859551_g1053_i022302580